MRKDVPQILEAGRVRTGEYGSDPIHRFNGAFTIIGLKLIVSDGTLPEAKGWEHVSVSLKERTPTWGEMCFVKNLCWHEDETVVQFHPKQSAYVTHHPNCLHLWRHKSGHGLPPTILVGPK